MSSAGNGTEDYYKKLGFRFQNNEEDESGASLDHYLVKVLGKDLAKMHELVLKSGSADDLNFNINPPITDLREKYRELLEDQQNAAIHSEDKAK